MRNISGRYTGLAQLGTFEITELSGMRQAHLRVLFLVVLDSSINKWRYNRSIYFQLFLIDSSGLLVF